MILQKLNFLPQKRRGLSSVVGALFFTVLMIAGFSVLSLALDAQTDIVTTQRIVSDIEIKKQQEDFRVLASTDGNNILRIDVNNLGQNPVEISSVWIVNKTLSDKPAKRFDVNYNDAFVSSGSLSNIVDSKTLQMIPDDYDIKIVSTYGTIKIIPFSNSGSGIGGVGLRGELITDPPDVIIGQNVTVAMMVTNTGLSSISDVTPLPLNFVSTGTGSVIASSPPTPTTVELNGGASVMFTWDYQVTGGSGDQLIFTGQVTGDGGTDTGPVSDISVLRLPTDGGTGGTNPDIVNDDLLARPQLFFLIPSSQGKSSDPEATWGINVVNPINADMEVSKLVITAFAPGAQNNDKLFDRAGGSCSFNPISPILGADSNWSCPSENSLMWQSTTPIIIPANSTQSFITKVEPGKPSGTASLESVIVQGSVFTTLGSFGKSGYQSTMSGTTSSIVNVYLSDNPNSRSDADIKSTRIGIIPDSLQTFHIVLADMDFDASTTINSNAKLIINIPKDWTLEGIPTGSGFGSITSVTFGDGASQLVAQTLTPLGDTNVADTITFTARAPNITEDQLFVMYVLAQGTTSNVPPFSVGPLAEIVLQVDG